MRTETLTKTKWTAEKYFAWSPPDSKTRYEVINGTLHTMSSPTFLHQTIVLNLCFFIKLFLHSKPLALGIVTVAPFDVVLGDDLFVPDVTFVRAERKAIISDKKMYGAPDMIAEVLSPSTAKYDLNDKKLIYAEYGVSEYWLIDPRRKTVTLHLLDGNKYVIFGTFRGDDTIRSQQITQFELTVSDLFKI